MKIDTSAFADTFKQMGEQGELPVEGPGFAATAGAAPAGAAPGPAAQEPAVRKAPAPAAPATAPRPAPAEPLVPEAATPSAAAPAAAPPPPQAAEPAIWTRRKRDADTSTSARRPNRQRAALAAAGLFAVGIVLGPWLAQRAVPPPPPPAAGHQAVNAIADTLKASALGMPVPALPSAATVAPEPHEAPAAAPVASAGEGRYLGMLAEMKSLAPSGSEVGIRVVPRGEPTAVQSGANKNPGNPYPDSPIPLALERAAQSSTPHSGPTSERGDVAMDVQPSGVATGRYTVLRIADSPAGGRSALMVPLGADEQTQAWWVRVGDATSDGFTVDAISARQVLLRTPAGRLVALLSQESP